MADDESESSEIRADGDPPRDLAVGFWTLVILVKVGVIAIGVGAVLIVETPYRTAGFALVLVGAGIGIHWIATYRRLRRQDDTQTA